MYFEVPAVGLAALSAQEEVGGTVQLWQRTTRTMFEVLSSFPMGA